MSAFVPAPNAGGELNLTSTGAGELIDAAANGKLDTVKSLIVARSKMGAERDHWTDWELLALTNAVIGGHADVVKFLLNAESVFFAKLFSKPYGGEIAFHAAAELGSVTMLKLLCEAGLNKDPSFRGFLLASANGHVAAVEFLLVSKISRVDQIRSWSQISPTYDGRAKCPTALWAASDAGHPDVVKLLLEWGAEVNHVSEGQTPLARALAGGHNDVSEILIAAGGKADAPAAEKVAKLDLGKFSALNLKLATPCDVVEDSRKKGTVTRQE